MRFSSILAKSTWMYRDNVVVTFDGRHQTYAELGERACRLANALADLGLEPGQRVAVLADNQLETVEQVAGFAVAGMVRCPMYTMNPAPTHAHMLNTVEASAIIVQDKYAADIASVRGQIPSVKHVIVIGGESAGLDQLSYEELLAAAESGFPDVVVGPDDDHIIRFSAGTTGKPKGILHTDPAGRPWPTSGRSPFPGWRRPTPGSWRPAVPRGGAVDLADAGQRRATCSSPPSTRRTS